MKLLLAIFLSITLTLTCGQHVTASLAESVTQTFTQLDQDVIQSSDLIQNIIEFGSQEILRFALEAGEIDNANFEVTAINSVATQNFDSSVFYNCSIHLENGEGFLINTWFTIFNQDTLTISVIVDYNFEVIHNDITIGELNDIIQLVAPNEDEYTAITVENDAIAQEALQTGAEEIVQLGVNAQTLTVADFTISQVTQALSQIIGNGIFYKFSVVLQNSAGQSVTATFEIYYQIYIEETRFVSYAYNLDGSALGDLTYVIPVLTLNGGFIKCSESEIRTSVPLFNDLDFGANTVADRGYDSGNIPSGSYVLYQIYSVEKFDFTLGTAYRYQIGFSNKNSVVVQTNFTVINQTIAQHLSLSTYSYQVSLNGYGTSSSTSTDSGDDIWVNCTITKDTIIGQKDWNNTNGTNSTNPVKSPGSGYVLLTAAEIQGDIVQACINYGMNNIIQIGVQLNSFPFSKWDLTEVIAVYQNNQNWGQKYQITLHLTNAKKLKMETTFTVSYNIATLLIRLNTYFYNVGGWKSTLTVASKSGLNTTDPNPPLISDLPYSLSNDGLEYASNGYYKIPLNWIDESDDIKTAINFGAQAVVQVGVNQNKIPVSDYIIYDVIWIQRYIGSKGDYYAIKLFLTNVDNVDLVITSTSYIVRATKAVSLYTYSYTASNILTTWYTPGGSQTTQNTSTIPSVSNISSLVITASWDALSSNEIQTNPEVQEVLQYGTDFIVNLAKQASNAPSCGFTISTINSVSTKSSIRGIYYLVNVVLSSPTNVNIATEFTVYIDRSNEGYAIASYKYQVSNDQGTIAH